MQSIRMGMPRSFIFLLAPVKSEAEYQTQYEYVQR